MCPCMAEIIESEKKLRILSVMKLVTHSHGSITVRDFIAGCHESGVSDTDSEIDSSVNLAAFSAVLSDCDAVCISDSEMSALVYIAGYVGFKLKKKLSCVDCRLEFFTEKALECEFSHDDTFNYMAGIDRGGLTWPTDLLLSIVVQCMITFKCFVSSTHAHNFNLTQNQRAIASGLALQRCLDVLDVSGKCSGCGAAPLDVMKMCIAAVTNISLNNYTKHLRDVHSKSKSLRKLSTLTK